MLVVEPECVASVTTSLGELILTFHEACLE